MADLAAARAIVRNGGRKFAITKFQLRLAQAAMSARDTKVSELYSEIGVTRLTLYRYVCPEGKIRPHGQKLLNS